MSFKVWVQKPVEKNILTSNLIFNLRKCLEMMDMCKEMASYNRLFTIL